MSYFKKRSMRGSLGGILDSYGTSGGTQPVPGQAMPTGTGTAATTPPPDPTKSNSGGGWGADLAKLFGALAINKLATPSSSPYVPPPTAAAGISPTTLLIGGAIGVTALVLLLK